MSLDPVCGRSISPKQSEWLVVRDGEANHFCSAECKQEFIGQSQPGTQRLSQAVAKPLAMPQSTLSLLELPDPARPVQQVAIAV